MRNDLLAWVKPRAQQTRQLYVAIDHGLSFADMPGLERPLELLARLAAHSEVDGLIASPGIYRQAKRQHIDLSAMKRLITVDYVAMEGETLTDREIILSPEEAADYDPHCYKMFFNIYDDTKERIRNIREFSRFASAGQRLGVASLAEVLFFNNRAFQDRKTQAAELFKGCRMAMETGADALKIPLIEDGEAIAEIIDRLGLPTFILGGGKIGAADTWQRQVRSMCALPISGLMFGRNVWQSEDMDRQIHEISQAML